MDSMKEILELSEQIGMLDGSINSLRQQVMESFSKQEALKARRKNLLLHLDVAETDPGRPSSTGEVQALALPEPPPEPVHERHSPVRRAPRGSTRNRRVEELMAYFQTHRGWSSLDTITQVLRRDSQRTKTLLTEAVENGKLRTTDRRYSGTGRVRQHWAAPLPGSTSTTPRTRLRRNDAAAKIVELIDEGAKFGSKEFFDRFPEFKAQKSLFFTVVSSLLRDGTLKYEDSASNGRTRRLYSVA